MSHRTTRRQFMKRVSAGAAALCLTSMMSCTNHSKPNIIYILTDDLGYGDLGCYGQQMIKTPRLDQMAADGLKFNQHYAGSTVCAPSRCALMTGQHLGHCTVRGNENVLLKSDDQTIAKTLKQVGYTTACIGKWGIGHPPPPNDPKNNGFDYFFGYLSMWHAHNYYPEFLWRNGEKVQLKNKVQHPKEHYQQGQEKLTGLAEKKVEYTPDLFTKDALRFIEDQVSPFFLFLSYTIPHANNEALWFDKHGMEVPDLKFYKDKDWPEPEKAKAAMITRMDSHVGQILDKLKELKIDKNTLVIFTSDNGPHKEGGQDPDFFDSNGKLRGYKRDLYEGGIRVPCLAQWTGTIEPGRVTDHISAFWDVYPTCAKIAGAPVPENLDGISFLPVLEGNLSEQREHDYLYWEFNEGSSKQAVRMGNWKMVRVAPSDNVELYDLSTDVCEEHNVASEHPQMVDKAMILFQNARDNETRWPLKDDAKVIPF